jgi:dihydrodipicolinate synthase/N-acetylneuraminate lyase
MFRRADELKQLEAPDLSTVNSLIGEINESIEKKDYEKAYELSNKAEEIIAKVKRNRSSSPQYLYSIFEEIELIKEGLRKAMVKKE